MNEPTVEYTCKILPLGNFVSMVIILNCALPVLFLGIYAGIPVFLNVLLLLGAMYLLIYLLSADAAFVVSADEITRNIRRASFLFTHASERRFLWNEIKAYKSGTDKGNYRGEFQFLEIRFRNGSEWKITDMYGERKADFSVFLQTFLAHVERYNLSQQKSGTPEPRHSLHTHITQGEALIERKKTLYETVWGKLITVLLGIFIVLVLLFAGPHMSGPSVFKLNFVLIPGFAYMFYRTFLKKYR
jgi:hypothetical protein